MLVARKDGKNVPSLGDSNPSWLRWALNLLVLPVTCKG
jgi:hypothetical protein